MSVEQAIYHLYQIAYHPHENEEHIRQIAKTALLELGEDLEAAEREMEKDQEELPYF
jgi:hypothetical protein